MSGVSSPGSNGESWTARMLGGVGLFLAMVALYPYVVRSFFRFPLNYNEGWNAAFAKLAVSGANIYSDAGQWAVNNYPPISFYLVGWVGRYAGDDILAGRWISVASLFVVAINIAVIVHLVSSRPLLGVYGAALFLATVSVAFPGYVGMNDPQWLAHAVMTTGMVLVCRPEAGLGRIVFGALVMVMAGFVKHNILAFPVAFALSLLLVRDRRLLKFAAAGTLFAVAGLMVCHLVFGPMFLANLLGSRTYSFYSLVELANVALSPLAVLIALFMVFAARTGFGWNNRIVELYVLCSLGIGLFWAGGAGTSFNVFFDLVIALSIAVALGVGRIVLFQAAPGMKMNMSTIMLVAVAPWIGILIPLAVAFRMPHSLMSDYSVRARATAEDVSVIAAAPGPALCATPALCYWAGKPLVVDVFNARQAFLLGRWDERKLAACIREKCFGVIQWRDRGLSAETRTALTSTYHLLRRSDNGEFWVP